MVWVFVVLGSFVVVENRCGDEWDPVHVLALRALWDLTVMSTLANRILHI